MKKLIRLADSKYYLCSSDNFQDNIYYSSETGEALFSNTGLPEAINLAITLGWVSKNSYPSNIFAFTKLGRTMFKLLQ